MISASTPLPVELIGALERLDVSLRSNRIDQRALDAVLTLIDALDPEYIPAAEVSFRRHLLMMEQFRRGCPGPAPVARNRLAPCQTAPKRIGQAVACS